MDIKNITAHVILYTSIPLALYRFIPYLILCMQTTTSIPYLLLYIIPCFVVTYAENGEYFLVANSLHISRVSVDGSSSETLYTDPLPAVIVGLDYDYRLVIIRVIIAL